MLNVECACNEMKGNHRYASRGSFWGSEVRWGLRRVDLKVGMGMERIFRAADRHNTTTSECERMRGERRVVNTRLSLLAE